ncbi:MAG: hypothetical protein HYY16_09790 [Planctomycetes bacterium]|nr:hypothetical protein [Planctomycetota bacterium]
MRLSLVPAVLLLCACRTPAGAGGPILAVRSELDFSSSPVEGEIGTFDVRIRNVSSKYVILRDLADPDAGTLVTWQVSLPGTLRYDPRAGEFEYDPNRRPPQPRPAWNVALLCPNEEIALRPRIRLLRLPRRYLLDYFVLEKDDLSSSVYFEHRAPGGIRYRRLSGDDLGMALSPTVSPLDQAVRSHRTVVYPHAESLLQSPRREPLILSVPLERRSFTLTDAAAAVGTPPTEFTYWINGDSWVLRDADGLHLAGPRGAQPLPQISDIETFFFLLDTLGDAAAAFSIRTPLEVRLTPHRFRILPAGEPPHRFVLHAGRADLPRLLAVLAEEKLRIDVTAVEGTVKLSISRKP